jgi:hypothetical protein
VYWKERKAHPDIVVKEMNAMRNRSNWTIDDAPVFNYAVRNEQSGDFEKGNTSSLNRDRQPGGSNSTNQEKHESRGLGGDASITRRPRGRPRKNLANDPVPTSMDGRVEYMAPNRRQDASDDQGMDSRSNLECLNSIERLPELRDGLSGSGHSPIAYQYPSIGRSPQISRTIPNSQESPGDSSSSPAVQLLKQQKSTAAAASLLQQFQRNSVPRSYLFSDDDEDISPVLNGRPNFNQAEDSHAIPTETVFSDSFDIPIDPALLDPSLRGPELLESSIVGQIPFDGMAAEPSSSTGHGRSRVVSDEPFQDFNPFSVNLAEPNEIKSKEADAASITGPQSNKASPQEHISPLHRPVSSPLKPQPLNKALRTPVASAFDSSKRCTTPTLKGNSPLADDPEADELIIASEDITILSAQKASQQKPQSPTPKPNRTPALRDNSSVSRHMVAPRHSFSPSSDRGNFGEWKKNLVETPSRNVRRASKSSLGSPYFKTPGGTMRKCGESGFRCERSFCFKCSAAAD